jgi:hypothetical protein
VTGVVRVVVNHHWRQNTNTNEVAFALAVFVQRFKDILEISQCLKNIFKPHPIPGI